MHERAGFWAQQSVAVVHLSFSAEHAGGIPHFPSVQ
jgi:hypothetical protein